jgi:hypothetical protein
MRGTIKNQKGYQICAAINALCNRVNYALDCKSNLSQMHAEENGKITKTLIVLIANG